MKNLNSNNTPMQSIEYSKLRKVVLMLRSVNHEIRLQIIDMLKSKNSLTVSEIHQQLKLEQSVASQHLAVLRRAGVVITHRDGKFIHYSLDKERLKEINDFIIAITK